MSVKHLKSMRNTISQTVKVTTKMIVKKPRKTATRRLKIRVSLDKIHFRHRNAWFQVPDRLARQTLMRLHDGPPLPQRGGYASGLSRAPPRHRRATRSSMKPAKAAAADDSRACPSRAISTSASSGQSRRTISSGGTIARGITA